tara:strand:- start:84 stop:605 length:522 start_codon:yes stop_codon:yes gene_type:complete
MTLIPVPHYNDNVNALYSVVFMNVFTLGACALISLFGFDDMFLFFLFWFQIIVANNNQGFLNKIYSYYWRVADIVGAHAISLYAFIYYRNDVPPFILYPFLAIMLIAAYSQSNATTISDHVLLVNLWHLLVLYTFIIIFYFRSTSMNPKDKYYDGGLLSTYTETKRLLLHKIM